MSDAKQKLMKSIIDEQAAAANHGARASELMRQYCETYAKLRVGDSVIVRRASGSVLRQCEISRVGIRAFGGGPDCAGDAEFRYQVRQKRNGNSWPPNVEVHLQAGDKIEKDVK